MQQANDYQVSEDLIGWNLFISKEEWSWFENNLGVDAMKRLSKSRTSSINRDDNKEECSECGGEPYPNRWFKTTDLKHCVKCGRDVTK